ncbi:hypothetical protein Acsp02_71680 [Actinoplanes sp. NBRC 103695]|nr:hypothetical protein Acsp02_71680 [Actinoplanes sp. NBRC 103695]
MRSVALSQSVEWHVLNVDQVGLDVGMGLIHRGATFLRDVNRPSPSSLDPSLRGVQGLGRNEEVPSDQGK